MTASRAQWEEGSAIDRMCRSNGSVGVSNNTRSEAAYLAQGLVWRLSSHSLK